MFHYHAVANTTLGYCPVGKPIRGFTIGGLGLTPARRVMSPRPVLGLVYFSRSRSSHPRPDRPVVTRIEPDLGVGSLELSAPEVQRPSISMYLPLASRLRFRLKFTRRYCGLRCARSHSRNMGLQAEKHSSPLAARKPFIWVGESDRAGKFVTLQSSAHPVCR